ncbi:MAG TPA: DUF1828 domain-containing protein [Alcaligenes sp.]|nr:DUF1828 domain-containing protein [Alcaligenes sp.]
MNLNLDALRTELCHAFCNHVEVAAHSPDEAVIHLPMTARDGDYLSAYVQTSGGGWRISDKGITMMRLSYEHDLDRLLVGARERLYQTVLKETGLQDEDGELFLYVPANALINGLFALAQGIIRIEDMGLWTRTRIESAFYEDLRHIIESFVPQELRVETYSVPEVPDAAHYPVDYLIKTPGKPLYLFGVLNRDKARLATIILQHLSRHAPPFDSMVVYADMDDIPKPDVRRLIAAANDIVPSIHDKDIVLQKIKHRLAA